MKKLLLCFVFLSGFVIAQAQSISPGNCGLLYTYDAAGNRIKQEYYCNNTGSDVQMRKAPDAIGTLLVNKETEEESSLVQVDVLYPNPTTGRFTVRFARELKQTEIVVTDATGKIVQQRKGNGYNTEFDLSTAPAGVYFVLIRNKKTTITQKVIKQ